MADRLTEKEIETIIKLRAEGYTLKYIAYKTKRHEKTITVYAGKGLKYWNDEELKEAVRLKKAGTTDREIGEKLGRTRYSVIQMFYKLRRGFYAGYSL